MTDDGDASSRLRSGRRLSRPNDRDTNPHPPGESESSLPNTDESQISQSLLSVDAADFTPIGRAHDGHGTTNPRDATVRVIAPTAVPTHNTFAALAPDDDDPSDLDNDAADDAPNTHTIDTMFREADATLAAATYDFELMSERLRLRLDRDLTATLTTQLASTTSDFGKSIEKSMSTFLTMIQQDVDNSTMALKQGIQSMDERIASMDERIAQMSDHLHVNNTSTTAAIETISSNTAKLAQETSALSVRMVEHQMHLENLLGFEEARRQQMDDHVKQMNELAAFIAEVKSNATVQTQRVSAQLDGLRATMDKHNTTTTTDIIDLRGRIVPELRDHTNTIAATVQSLENRLISSDASSIRTVANIEERLVTIKAELDAFTKPGITISPPRTHVTPTPADDDDTNGADEVPPVNPRFPKVDPTTFRATPTWYVPEAAAPSTAPVLRPHSIDTTTSDDETALLMGGRITSPRATDKERQARRLHISRHDVAGLATPAYHGGRHGVQELTLSYIHACGYSSFSPEIEDDVLPCYGAIQLLHKKVRMAWTNPRTLQSGPSVERILEKGLAVFPKLRGTSAREAVTFYESLQQVSASYLLPIMPFDTICLANNYEGLFPPGLGTDAYCECCTAMLEVLPRLIPVNDYEVSARLSGVRNSSRNGYDLLWRILELFVPGFDPTVPIAQPVWNSDSSILDFCQGHMLYFRLQAKKNMFFSSRDRTTIFLRAVTPSEYADVVTSLQTSVDAYRHPDNDGILPDHLRLDGIATLIHNNAKHRVRDLHSPRIHKVAGMSSTWDAADDDELAFSHVQGYCPRAFRTEGQRPSDGFRSRGDDRHRGNLDGRYGTRNSRPTPDKSQGRFTRPDQRRRAYKPGVQCDACKRIGHDAVNCDMLAIALYINRYLKDVTDSERSAIESRWIEKYKEKLGQPARTPRQIMQTYCDNYNITPDYLDQAMDWDCWPDQVHDISDDE